MHQGLAALQVRPPRARVAAGVAALGHRAAGGWARGGGAPFVPGAEAVPRAGGPRLGRSPRAPDEATEQKRPLARVTSRGRAGAGLRRGPSPGACAPLCVCAARRPPARGRDAPGPGRACEGRRSPRPGGASGGQPGHVRPGLAADRGDLGPGVGLAGRAGREVLGRSGPRSPGVFLGCRRARPCARRVPARVPSVCPRVYQPVYPPVCSPCARACACPCTRPCARPCARSCARPCASALPQHLPCASCTRGRCARLHPALRCPPRVPVRVSCTPVLTRLTHACRPVMGVRSCHVSLLDVDTRLYCVFITPA